jgi:hypothetical protein
MKCVLSEGEADYEYKCSDCNKKRRLSVAWCCQEIQKKRHALLEDAICNKNNKFFI